MSGTIATFLGAIARGVHLETRFWKPRSRDPKVSPQSRSRPLCLESRSRHCSDVGKAQRCCKYVMISSKNRLFVRVFSNSGVIVLFKFALVTVALNHGNLYQGCGVGRFKIRLQLQLREF